MKNILLLVLLTVAVLGCKNKPNLQEDAQMIAKLQFDAKMLQDKRFAYADSLNRADAEKLKNKTKFSQSEMEDFYRKKQDLSTETAMLSSLIASKMDSLFSKSYKTKEERTKFDTEMEIAFNKILAENR
jgi:hypothetical protein